MSTYQEFLNFFSMHNKERLDGLNESYFDSMTQEERIKAFDYLMKFVEAGGDEETVNGLFMADRNRATESVSKLFATGRLRGEAEIVAAWNVFNITNELSLLPIFTRYMSDVDHRLREKAAYYVPSKFLTEDLKAALQGMIRTETEQLARIHAVDKILECYGVTRESVGAEIFSSLYKGLHSPDLKIKENAFRELDDLYK